MYPLKKNTITLRVIQYPIRNSNILPPRVKNVKDVSEQASEHRQEVKEQVHCTTFHLAVAKETMILAMTIQPRKVTILTPIIFSDDKSDDNNNS